MNPLAELADDRLTAAHDRWHDLAEPTLAEKAAHQTLASELAQRGTPVQCGLQFDTKPLPERQANYIAMMQALAATVGKWEPWEVNWSGPGVYLWDGIACAGCLFYDDGCTIVDVETVPAAGCRMASMTPGFADLFTVPDDDEVMEAAKSAQIVKSAELRYTLGPWYVPEVTDAHGEWTDADELQQALWSYVKAGDRRIRLQHDRDVVAGEWVEAVSWPFDVQVPLTLPDEQDRTYLFKAGTVFLGVIWEPWAWDRVKAGEIRGFSIGGEAVRVDMEGPGE